MLGGNAKLKQRFHVRNALHFSFLTSSHSPACRGVKEMYLCSIYCRQLNGLIDWLIECCLTSVHHQRSYTEGSTGSNPARHLCWGEHQHWIKSFHIRTEYLHRDNTYSVQLLEQPVIPLQSQRYLKVKPGTRDSEIRNPIITIILLASYEKQDIV